MKEENSTISIFNPNQFLSFGKFTEPYEDKIVSEIAKKIKKPWDVFKYILDFQKINVGKKFLTVKEMEDKNVVGECSEQAFLTAAILRKASFPTALIFMIRLDTIYNDPTNPYYADHMANLVWYDDMVFYLDSTRFSFAKFSMKYLLKNLYFPVFIFKDPEDFGVNDRKSLVRLGIKELFKKFPMFELEKDNIYYKWWDLLET